MNLRIRKLLRKVTSPFYLSITDVIELIDLSHYFPKDGRHRDKPVIRLIKFSDLNCIRVDHGQTTELRFRKRMASSAAYLALDGNATVGWLWVTQKNRPKEGVHPFFYSVNLSNEMAYIYDCFSVPYARHQGIMKSLLCHALTDLKQAGMRYVIFTHDASNTAMQRLAQTYGFTVFGTLIYRRWLWWKKRDISDLEKVCTLN